PQTVVGIITLGITLFLVVSVNPVLKKRFVADVSSIELPIEVSGWNGANIRIAIWKCSTDAFKNSVIFGYGIGDQGVNREKCYQAYSFYGVFGTDLNSHNQFLEYGLIGGLVLILLFIFQIGYSIKVALNSRSILHLSFLILFVVTCCGESLLEQHKGIIFFSYFNSLFLFMPRVIENKL
ncbi:MAG: O-antigen ligase family protein, partial [Flammeovirgaceae bacterium]|nr:O-antigen ligase family protein [Flammeovirgaceae bacterium]